MKERFVELFLRATQKVVPGLFDQSPQHDGAAVEQLKNSGWPVPESGFIRDYLNWAVPRTEAPVAFHFGPALTLAGMMLGRKCVIRAGGLDLYPNFYSVAFGPSTLVRKTTSISSMPRSILLRVEEKIGPKHSLILSDVGTPEGLLNELAEKQTGIKSFNEFGDFLRKIKKREFMGDYAGLLTELYDCPASFSKKLSQKYFKVQDPFLSILAASTREWMLNAMEESDIESGFLARFLFFVGDDSFELIPIVPERDKEAEEKLAIQLEQLHRISNIFQPTGEAESVYSDWYGKHRGELKKPGMGLLSSYYGRLEGYVWKIALIFEATSNGDLKVISADSVHLAINFVERLKRDLKPLILEDFQPGYWAKRVQKVRVLIKSVGPNGIIRSSLLKNSHLKAKELTEVLNWLREAGEITWETTGTGGTRYVYIEDQQATSESVE